MAAGVAPHPGCRRRTRPPRRRRGRRANRGKCRAVRRSRPARRDSSRRPSGPAARLRSRRCSRGRRWHPAPGPSYPATFPLCSPVRPHRRAPPNRSRPGRAVRSRSTLSGTRPSGEKNWRRLFSRSATTTVPSGPTAIPCGRWNCPGPAPGSPHEKRWRPSRENLCTRALPYPSADIQRAVRGERQVRRVMKRRDRRGGSCGNPGWWRRCPTDRRSCRTSARGSRPA